MCLLKPDGTLVAANRASLDFIGADEVEILGKPFWLTPWWTHSRTQQNMVRAAIRKAARGESVRCEMTHASRDGALHRIDFCLKPVADENDRIFLLVAEGHDVTEETRTQEELRESEEKYRLLFSTESDAILIFDADSKRVLEANAAASRLYGYSLEEFSGMKFDRITAESDKITQRVDDVLAGRLSRLPLVQHRKKDGTIFPAEISFGTFSWKNSRVIIEIIRDITEREKVVRMRDEMLAAVSHEMLTPLTAVIGFTEHLLESAAEPAQQHEYLEIILKESGRLKGLIDNLLIYQRLRAGIGLRTYNAVEVLPLLEGVIQLFEKFAEEHQLRLDCPANLPPLLGDKGRLLHALRNLISNAIKYSPAGSTVTLGARQEDSAVTLWVSDEGPGIRPDLRDKIFDRFFHIDSRDGRRIGGTGLGLPLVKEIVHLHQGRVWVESSPGQGSTFKMSFPLDIVCWLDRDSPASRQR
jgi:PAS domain S-box-containing protein